MTEDVIKILMIDDDEEDFMIIQDTIAESAHHHYKIEWTPSYNEGLKDISKQKHDVYLIDYILGIKTGLDLVKEAIKMGCEVPLIILTGRKDIEIDKQAMLAGASDYMVKGTITGQMLESSIRYAIANARHRKEMKDLNAELEERIKQRTFALEETLKDLKKSQQELLIAKKEAERTAEISENASKAKTHFLSNMSHEIRTPMNAIIGFTKVVLRSELNEKQKEYLNAIKVSGESLIVLINDILDLAKVESGKMTFVEEPFRLQTTISTMLQLFQARIDEKKLELSLQYDQKIPENILGDQLRLNQVIINLVSNAVKFTSRGKISVSVNQLEENDESVLLEFKVSDTGIGIPENNLNIIFEKFQQASSKIERVFGGTGLGLAIVKELVELQGGELIVRSTEGIGSTFGFTMNFRKTIQNPESELELIIEPEPGMKEVKILVAEDIPLNQLLIKTILDEFGFGYDLASDGNIAIEKLNRNKYDIVLMDLQMPGASGFEVTDYLRNILRSSVPVIALTADVTTMDADKCRLAGMNDYIAKPIDDKLLYSKIFDSDIEVKK